MHALNRSSPSSGVMILSMTGLPENITAFFYTGSKLKTRRNSYRNLKSRAMKKNVYNFLATIILAFVLSQFLPWWSVMLAALITSVFISLKRSAVFFVPFIGVFIFWIVYAYWLSGSNDFVLANKIAVLLPLQGNPYLLILINGIIGGLAAGIAAVFGKQCVVLFFNKE